jgi:hypothetical protein
MKAFPKPSGTTLWIARLSALLFLGSNLARFVSYSSERDSVIVTYLPHQTGMTGGTIVSVHHGPTDSLFIHVLLFACLSFGLLMLNRKPARIMVMLAAACSIAVSFYGVFHLLYLITISRGPALALLHHVLFFEILVGCLGNLALQFAYFWLAFRPPASAEKGGGTDLPPFATAQSV